jgi:hypothetical protein
VICVGLLTQKVNDFGRNVKLNQNLCQSTRNGNGQQIFNGQLTQNVTASLHNGGLPVTVATNSQKQRNGRYVSVSVALFVQTVLNTHCLSHFRG